MSPRQVTTIFVVIIEDKHVEPYAELFDNAAAAIRWAEAHVKECEEHYRRTADRTLLPSMVRAGWLYYAVIESAIQIRVVSRCLHEEG